jgi:topoisomerase IA-like protein
VSSRTKRPFSAFLVRQPDGKIGFEFEPRAPGARGGARGGRGAAALRILGPHPKDKRPVELHAGRYGPYVKHGELNATLPDREAVDSLTLEQALALLAEKAGKAPARTPKRAPRSAGTAAKAKAPDANEAASSKVTKRATTRAKATGKVATSVAAPRATAGSRGRPAVKEAATARKRTSK